jgi:hypothetical protein
MRNNIVASIISS